jgi:hypothetical protein
MALITTAGASDADSYATLSEADLYLDSSGYDILDWEDLEDTHKEFRLRVGALLINTLPLRGAKACRDQRLEFPRWWRTDSGYPSYEYTYLTMADITSEGYTPPTISTDVKNAQIEISFHVVHNGILKMNSMEYPDRSIKSFMLGGSLAVEFTDRLSLNSALFDKARLSTLDVAYSYLYKWLRKVSGGAA